MFLYCQSRDTVLSNGTMSVDSIEVVKTPLGYGAISLLLGKPDITLDFDLISFRTS